MAKEYIEREAIKYEQWAVGPLNEPLMVVRKKTVDAIPAADVAPVVHGRWVRYRFYDGCPVCGKSYSISGGRASERFNYCPNCGAKMDMK